MSMKEIKVKVIGYTNLPGQYNTKIHTEVINGCIDYNDIGIGKTYKLVEDVPTDTFEELKNTCYKLYDKLKSERKLEIKPVEMNYKVAKLDGTLLNHLVIDEMSKEELEEWKKANPNAFKQPTFGERGGGKKLKMSTMYGVFPDSVGVGVTKPNKRVLFNDNATILEIGDFKTVVKCDEKDTFEEYIGLGLALSRYYAKHPATKNEFATLKYCFNTQYKDLAAYCIHKWFDYDDKRILKFFDGIEKGKWVEL